MSELGQPTVLIVEDEPAVAASFEMMLQGEYEVRKAVSGEEALETVDGDVDVVLLDRMLPGISGREVLDELRERGLDCRVAMVTAVDPDFDIIEMGFDDYVRKPPTKTELRQVVDDLLTRSAYDETVRRYHSLLSKRAALQTEKSSEELAESEEYAELESRIDDLEEELSSSEERLLDDAEFVGAFRDLTEEDPEVDR